MNKKVETMKTPDEWAREFKLWHCVGSKSFAKQVQKIQEDAAAVTKKNLTNKPGKV
jgi:hypothetical protein